MSSAKHKITLCRTDEDQDLPWAVGCLCGWKSRAATKEQASKSHAQHRAESAPTYTLWRRFGSGALYVKVVPTPGRDWGYTADKNDALVVDSKTKARFLRHMKDVGKKGFAIPQRT